MPSRLLLLLIFIVFSSQSFALEKKRFCVWDPVGANGPVITFMKETRLKAIEWGIDLELLPYTDEKVSANDFKAGACDAVFLTDLLVRQFVPFAGSLNAVGGIQTNAQLKTVLKTLASPKAGKILTHNKYEVAGIFPVGSAFLYVRDKNIQDIKDFSGKRISVLNDDIMAKTFVEKAGGSPVNTTLSTFSGQFNNGNVDVIFAPALAYNAFELYQGLGDKGGIVDYRLLFALLQMVIYKDNFPENFGNQMRAYAFSRIGEIEKMVFDAEKEIPKKYWIGVDKEKRKEYDRFTRELRIAMKAKNEMDPKALRLLWKIRCKLDASRGECATPE